MKQKIIIIGGGIVGSTTAFYLSQVENTQVTLIDYGKGTATRAAAGIICPWLSQRRNKDWYRLTSQGAAFYLKLMEDLKGYGVSQLPYKQTGTIVFKNQDGLLQKLKKLAENRAKDAPMIGELSIHKGRDLAELIPQLNTQQGAVLASGGGRLDGGQLLDTLQEIIIQNGGLILTSKASLKDENTVIVDGKTYHADQIVLTCGAWLSDILMPLGYKVDVRPQKGQLLEIQTDYQTDDWSGCMLHGEIDILPFEDGKLVIGATHEDDMGYDLTLDMDKIARMKQTAQEYMPNLSTFPISTTRVGTRAYTSDYAPFYGNLMNNPQLWVASGLGSSGLTPFELNYLAEIAALAI